MDDERKRKYRKILYRAMLEMRAHQPVSPLDDGRLMRRLKYPACYRRTRELQDLADVLHNLAAFAVGDFTGFDEGRFWGEMDRLGRRHPGLGEWMVQIRAQVDAGDG